MDPFFWNAKGILDVYKRQLLQNRYLQKGQNKQIPKSVVKYLKGKLMLHTLCSLIASWSRCQSHGLVTVVILQTYMYKKL